MRKIKRDKINYGVNKCYGKYHDIVSILFAFAFEGYFSHLRFYVQFQIGSIVEFYSKLEEFCICLEKENINFLMDNLCQLMRISRPLINSFDHQCCHALAAHLKHQTESGLLNFFF